MRFSGCGRGGCGEGAVDPFPFIDPVRVTVPELAVDTERLGAWNRVRNGGARLRTAPGTGGDVVRELDRHTPLRILAGSGSFFRARLLDGTTGYVAARLTEPVETAPELNLRTTSDERASQPGASR